MIRKTSKQIGEVSGIVIGEPIKFLGRKLNKEFIIDIGETVKQASIQSLDSAGQAAEGVWNTSSGLFQKDPQKVQEGLGDIKGFAVRTGKGIVEVSKHTFQNGENVYKGIRDGDQERLLAGTKELAKTVAVTTLAVGALDFLDIVDGVDAGSAQTFHDTNNPELDVSSPGAYDSMEVEDAYHYSSPDYSAVQPGSVDVDWNQGVYSDPEHIDTRNEELMGGVHPETGVPFVEQEVPLPSGETITGVFPDFDEAYSTTIPDWMYQYSDSQHFSYANMQLSYGVETDLPLAETFTEAQLQQIAEGQTPDGYTWHHSEITGRLELVETETHAQTAHTGGRELWGGGEIRR